MMSPEDTIMFRIRELENKFTSGWVTWAELKELEMLVTLWEYAL